MENLSGPPASSSERHAENMEGASQQTSTLKNQRRISAKHSDTLPRPTTMSTGVFSFRTPHFMLQPTFRGLATRSADRTESPSLLRIPAAYGRTTRSRTPGAQTGDAPQLGRRDSGRIRAVPPVCQLAFNNAEVVSRQCPVLNLDDGRLAPRRAGNPAAISAFQPRLNTSLIFLAPQQDIIRHFNRRICPP